MSFNPDYDHTASLLVMNSLSALYPPVRSSYVAEKATLRMVYGERVSTLSYDSGDNRSDGTA
jgi:hypothetical protein